MGSLGIGDQEEPWGEKRHFEGRVPDGTVCPAGLEHRSKAQKSRAGGGRRELRGLREMLLMQQTAGRALRGRAPCPWSCASRGQGQVFLEGWLLHGVGPDDLQGAATTPSKLDEEAAQTHRCGVGGWQGEPERGVSRAQGSPASGCLPQPPRPVSASLSLSAHK